MKVLEGRRKLWGIKTWPSGGTFICTCFSGGGHYKEKPFSI